MKIITITMKFCLFLIVGAPLAPPLLKSYGTPSGGEGQKAIVVIAEGTNGHVSYKVDSQPVKDLLLSLSRLEERRGPNCPVVALIDPRLPIEEIWSIDGTAAKAQFTNVRFFIFFRDTGKMSELRQMPAIPFSANPVTE